MEKCVGVKHSKGNFENDKGKSFDYDNIVLYCVNDSDPDVFGYSAYELKIKVSNFSSVTGLSIDDFYDLFDKEIEISFSMIKNKPVLSRILIKEAVVNA